MQSTDYSVRYGKGFDKISSLSRKLQNYRCCGCGQVFEANELQFHHFCYADEADLLGDRIVPGIHGVSLHGSRQDVGSCHWRAHQKDAWIVDKADKVKGNRNTDAFIEACQKNFHVLTGIDPSWGSEAVREAIARRFPMHEGVSAINSAWAELPTTPTQVGSTPPPESWTEHNGELINAPIRGDIAPNYEPSYQFKRDLSEMFSRVEQHQEELSNVEAIARIIKRFYIPLLALATFILVLLIAGI